MNIRGKHFYIGGHLSRQFGLKWEFQICRLHWYLCPYFLTIGWTSGDYLGEDGGENKELVWINFKWLGRFLNNRARRKSKKNL